MSSGELQSLVRDCFSGMLYTILSMALPSWISGTIWRLAQARWYAWENRGALGYAHARVYRAAIFAFFLAFLVVIFTCLIRGLSTV